MKTKFLVFFSLIALASILSTLDSWIIQYQLHGEVSSARAIFQICLVALVLYLLWRRSTLSYILATAYVLANAVLYGYELTNFFVSGSAAAPLSVGVIVVSAILIASTAAALVLLALDYLDYRVRRAGRGGLH